MGTNLITELQKQTKGRRRARTRALRFMLAWANADSREMTAVMREAAAEQYGIPLLLVTLADAANQTAAQVYPANWRQQLEFVTMAERAMHDEPQEPTWGVKK